MKIYEIEFTRIERIQVPEDAVLPEGLDRDNLHEHITEKIHLGADCFGEALDIAVKSIEEFYFEDIDPEDMEYDINGVRELPDIFVLNWPGEGTDCDCPMCRAEKMADEDVMKVECPKCGDITRIALDGWVSIKCHKCETEIERSSLIETGLSLYKVLNLNINTDL